jgi:hypothetical protein
MNNMRYMCRRDTVSGMGAMGAGITDFLTSLPAAITGVNQGVSTIEQSTAQLETAIKAQLALSAVVAVGTIILVLQGFRGRS